MEFYNTHILTVVLFTPLVGALLLLFVPRDSETAHRVIGNLFAFLGLIVSLPLIWRFSLDPSAPRFQFHGKRGLDSLDRRALHAGHRRHQPACW